MTLNCEQLSLFTDVDSDPKPFHFTLNLEVYPFDIMFSIGEETEVLIERWRELGADNPEKLFSGEVSKGRCIFFENRVTLIRFRSVYLDHSVIAHEILHAIINILDDIGLPLKPEHNDEAYTYLMGFICQRFYDKLKEHDGRHIVN